MNLKEYLEVIIEVNPTGNDLACDVMFSNFDCSGVITETEEFDNLELVSKQNNIVKGYILNENISTNDIKNIIKEQYNSLLESGFTKDFLGTWNVSVTEVKNQDWSKKWKENWKPTKISDKITICPSWIEYTKNENETVINIDPEAAFGTGTHATTQLCVYAMEKYLCKGDKVADIGTGTGILAIIASKLGAKNVFGIDNDSIAISTAINNAKKNNVNNCEFKTCEINAIEDEYDFLAANILHNVLAEIMGDLKRIVKPDGKIVLSGILNTKADVVKNAIFKYGLDIIETKEQNQWISFIVTKRKNENE